MMEEDLEARLLGQRSLSPRALDDSMQRMYGHGMQQQPTSPASTPSMGPPLRDMRKKRRTPDIAAPVVDGAPSTSSHSRSSSTASSPGSLSPREPLSPRSSSPSLVADVGNPFDDPKPAPAQKTASPAQKATALPPSPSTTTSSTTAAGAGGASQQQQQRSAEPRSPVEVAKPAQAEGAAVEAGDDSEEDQEGKQRRAGAKMRDEEALSSLRTRMERLWDLEEEHAVLERRYARLDQTYQKTEQERQEWQGKYTKEAEENEKLNREKAELEANVQKLQKRLDEERERYALLSSQFSELNAKMVEIINNVTHLQFDEIEQEKALKRTGMTTPTRKKPQPAQQAPSVQSAAHSAAAYFGFGASPAKASTPTKPRPRE